MRDGPPLRYHPPEGCEPITTTFLVDDHVTAQMETCLDQCLRANCDDLSLVEDLAPEWPVACEIL